MHSEEILVCTIYKSTIAVLHALVDLLFSRLKPYPSLGRQGIVYHRVDMALFPPSFRAPSLDFIILPRDLLGTPDGYVGICMIQSLPPFAPTNALFEMQNCKGVLDERNTYKSRECAVTTFIHYVSSLAVLIVDVS